MAEKNEKDRQAENRDKAAKLRRERYVPRSAAGRKTAREVLAAHGDKAAADAAQRAADAGVTHPAYIDYDKALKNYEERDDVEPLDKRNSRLLPSEFSDADWRRSADVEDQGLVVSGTPAQEQDAVDKKTAAEAKDAKKESK